MSEVVSVRSVLESLDQQFDSRGAVFVVLSGTSEANPVQNFYRTDGLTALPLFMGTPYAGWHEVMPFLAQVTLESAFWDWVEESGSTDWGWACYSLSSFDDVFSHWRSLTKINLAGGSEVFFRYWDARFLEPVLGSLEGPELRAVMGPAESIVTPGGTTITRNADHLWALSETDFPWFTLPAAAERNVASLCWDLLVDNTVSSLASVPHTPLASYPPEVGRRKVEKQLRRLASGGVITELSGQQVDDIHQALVRERQQVEIGMRSSYE